SQQNVSVQSGGVYNSDEMTSDLAVINVFAGGNATVLVLKSLEANVKAGGVINVYGNPKELRQDILLGGVINQFSDLPDSE
ncbi:MAG: GIN domain-containing protein, partial [Fusobacteriaceae bacterium]